MRWQIIFLPLIFLKEKEPTKRQGAFFFFFSSAAQLAVIRANTTFPSSASLHVAIPILVTFAVVFFFCLKQQKGDVRLK